MSTQRRRLAFVSPLPPVRSGIADYARDLLPHLVESFEVEVFVDERHPLVAEGAYGTLQLHPGTELGRRFTDFDCVVYQLGNNLHHRFVLEIARQLPGIVVLHDLVLHHLYEEIAGVEDEWEAYGAALREGYGPIGAAVVQWKRWRLASERENFELPLFEPIGARSRGILVHSRSAEAAVRRRLPQTPVERIPMGIPREPELDRDGARGRLRVSPEQVLIGAFGFLTPIKRLDVLARALREAWRQCPELRLVLVGEESPGLRLEEIFTRSELAGGHLEHRGYVAEDEYRDWMAATDVAVNLRFPSAGETSASLLRLLGAGKCTLVSAYRQFLEIPAAAAVRIPLGAGRGGDARARAHRSGSRSGTPDARRQRSPGVHLRRAFDGSSGPRVLRSRAEDCAGATVASAAPADLATGRDEPRRGGSRDGPSLRAACSPFAAGRDRRASAVDSERWNVLLDFDAGALRRARRCRRRLARAAG